MPVIAWYGLSDVELDVFCGRRPDEVLEADQTEFIFVKDGRLRPIQVAHYVLEKDCIDVMPFKSLTIFGYLVSLVHKVLGRM